MKNKNYILMSSLHIPVMTFCITLLVFCISCFTSVAQTTLCAPLITTNSNGKVTFNFRNNNAFDILITDIQAQGSSTVASNTEAWYRPSALAYPNAASFPALTVANWTQFGNSTAGMILNTNVSLFGGGLSLLVPAGATYGICISVCQTASPTTGSLRYSSLVAGTSYSYPAGGCDILSGGPAATNASAAGAPRLSSATFANVPRGFLGCVTFMAAAPCSGTPAPGNTILTAGSNPICPSESFTLGLQNPTSGTGVTYQWQSADDAAFTVNLTNLGTSSSQVTSQTAPKYYRCDVTCSGNTTTSNPLQVTMNTLLNCYCTASHTSCSGDGITNVTLNTSLNNTSAGCPGVGNYTRFFPGVSQTTLVEGSQYTLTMAMQTDPNQFCNAWIDFNIDGILSAGEALGATYNGGSLGTFTFTVPGGITPGLTRLRVRGGVDATFTTAQACGANVGSTFGEVEDYDITLALAAPCSGTPTAGTVVSDINSAYGSVCSGSNFSLSLSGTSIGTGLTYQWESSPDNTTYTPIGSATNSSYTTNIAAATWFRCVVTCSNSGLSDTSPAYQVNVSSIACYCLGTYTNAGGGGGDFGLNIVNVNLAGINNSSSANLVTPYVYSNFTYVSGNVQQSGSYPISISRTYTGNTIYWGVWVDWNNSGTFTDDVNEYTSLTAAGVTGGFGAAIGTGTLNVPATATPGPHLMRIRSNFSLDPGQASICNNYTYGETEDYTINVVVPCSGVPVPGTTTSSSVLACANVPFTLFLQGTGAALDLTYQWETSPDNIAAYVPIPGATNQTRSQTQNASAYYRCTITCFNSGLSASSTPLQVNMNTFANCVCNTPVYSIVGCTGTTANDYIGQVTFAGINNTTTCGAVAPNYQFFPGQIANVNQTVTYPVTISAPAAGAAFQRFKMYIDFNDNASFDDPGETVFNSGPISTSVNSATGNISIDPNAPLGSHRLRVRSTNPLASNIDANSCSDDGYAGEVEDYTVVIAGPPPCSGTPTPGQTLASTPLACNATTINLALQNATSGTGVTYQWQSSADAAFTSPVNLGFNSTQSTTQTANTWYRCIVTCSGSDGTSTPVLVSHSSVCYCTNPIHGSDGCALGLYIDNFTFAGINNTSGCFTPVPYTTPYYSYYPALTATVDLGASYPISITTPTNPGNYFNHFAVWIDYNDNGSFDDAGEDVIATALGSSTATNSLIGNITIPNSAPPGTHKLRIRSGNTDQNWTSCAAASSGETEDYNIIISPPATSASSNSPVCETTTLNLSALPSGATSYSWIGPGGYSSSSQNPSITNVNNTHAGTYTCTMVIFGFTYVTTTEVIVNENPSVSVTASPAFCEGTDDLVIDADASGGFGPYVFSYLGNNTPDGIYTFPNAPASASGLYTITAVDGNGCIGTGSATALVYALPPVLITPIGNTNLCTGQTTTDLQAGGALDYAWSTSETTSLITVSTQGNYSVTGTDINGCVNTDLQVITESLAPTAPIVTPAGPVVLCSDGFTTSSALLTVTNYTTDLLWTSGETTQSISVDYPDAFNVTYTDLNGCYSVSNTVSTTVDLLSTDPTGASSNALFNSVCLGNSVTLSVTGGSLGDNASWVWYESGCGTGASIGTGASVTITPSTLGSHSYFVRAESASCGNTSCGSISITVTSSPPLSGASITTYPLTGCNGTTATMSGPTVSGATYYNWSCAQGGVLFNGNPGPYQSATPSVTVTFLSYPPAGASGYSICMFAGNACGQTATFCRFVRGRVSQPATITGNIIACPSTNLPYSVPAVTGADTYTWTVVGNATINGGGTTFTSASTNITVNFLAGWTSGSLSVYASLNCGFNSAARTMTFSSTPATPGIMSGPGNVCPSGSSSFSVPVVPGAATYTWTCSVPGAIVTPSANSCSISFPAVIPAGSTVCVTASSACGSSSAQRCKGIANGIPNTPSTISGPLTGQCGQLGVSYSVIPVTGATSYLWTANNGATVPFNFLQLHTYSCSHQQLRHRCCKKYCCKWSCCNAWNSYR